MVTEVEEVGSLKTRVRIKVSHLSEYLLCMSRRSVTLDVIHVYEDLRVRAGT
jgi:hypothetical protein